MFNKSVRNIEFELTNRCNAGCPLCSRTGTNKGGLSDPVSNSGWKDVLSKISEAHPKSNLAQQYGKTSVKDTQVDAVIKKHRRKRQGKV